MRYNQPLDQPSNPNAPYVDGSPAAGIEGSIVPGASIEFDQREIIEVIQTAFNRNYTDFSGAACAAPSNVDLTQLRKAIEGFFRTLPTPSWYIDTPVTYTVHGSGANFPDLNSALEYLSKYIITHNGFVTLQIAAGRWSYGGATVTLDHANSDRILITGANLVSSPIPSDFNVTGGGSSARANDRTVTLNRLRTRYATELDFTGAGIISNGTGMTLKNLLLVGDRTGPTGLVEMTQGLLYVTAVSCCNAGGYGGFVAAGGLMTFTEGTLCSATGSVIHGLAVATGGNVWHEASANLWFNSNDANGIGAGFNCGASGNASVGCDGNGGAGIACTVQGFFQVGPNSQFYMNAGNGVFIDQGEFYADVNSYFGSNGSQGLYVTVASSAQISSGGIFSGNSGGSIVCGAGSFVNCSGCSGVAGSASPAVNTGTADGSYILF